MPRPKPDDGCSIIAFCTAPRLRWVSPTARGGPATPLVNRIVATVSGSMPSEVPEPSRVGQSLVLEDPARPGEQYTARDGDVIADDEQIGLDGGEARLHLRTGERGYSMTAAAPAACTPR